MLTILHIITYIIGAAVAALAIYAHKTAASPPMHYDKNGKPKGRW